MKYQYILMQMPRAINKQKGMMSYDYHKEQGIDLAEYCWMWRDNIEGNDSFSALENIFELFNMERPEQFCGHSMSVGDIIKLKPLVENEDEDDTPEYWYCDNLGWKKLTDIAL